MGEYKINDVMDIAKTLIDVKPNGGEPISYTMAKAILDLGFERVKKCHCGQPATKTEFSPYMNDYCDECTAVRCDAYPGACDPDFKEY